MTEREPDAGAEALGAMLESWRERGRDWESRDYYPAFIDLKDRLCLVVGAGKVGQGKIAGLLAAGARVRVVSLEATKAVAAWAHEGRVELQVREFSPGDLDGCFLVVAATEDTALNEAIFAEAEARRMLCNVVDVPRLCSFILPSIHRDGDLAIAISTGGASPALARKIRLELGARYGHEQALALKLLGSLREEAKSAWPSPGDRKVIFERMVYAPVAGSGPANADCVLGRTEDACACRRQGGTPTGRRLLDLIAAGDTAMAESWVERCLGEGPSYLSGEEHRSVITCGLILAGVDPEQTDPSH